MSWKSGSKEDSEQLLSTRGIISSWYYHPNMIKVLNLCLFLLIFSLPLLVFSPPLAHLHVHNYSYYHSAACLCQRQAREIQKHKQNKSQRGWNGGRDAPQVNSDAADMLSAHLACSNTTIIQLPQNKSWHNVNVIFTRWQLCKHDERQKQPDNNLSTTSIQLRFCSHESQTRAPDGM